MPTNKKPGRKTAKKTTGRKAVSPTAKKAVAENKKLKSALRKVTTILKRAVKAKRKTTRKVTGY